MFALFLFTHFAYYRSRVGNNKTPLQHLYALAERIESSFAVELKPDSVYLLFDFRAAMLQKFLVLVNKYKIVHISYIVLDSEPFFYKVVEVVQDGESYKLRYLGAEPYTNITAERVYNFASSSRYLSVFNPLAYCSLCYVVAYAREIVVYITLEHPPVAAVGVIITA